MVSGIRSRVSYANVTATIALFVALGGGARAAFDTGGSDQTIQACYIKKNGNLHLQKGKKCPPGERPISWNAKGPPGPSGLLGAQGLQGIPGPAGTARAYGFVDVDGKLSQSKNASVTKPPSTEGAYCISVPGVSALDTPIVVTAEGSEGANLYTGTITFSGGTFSGGEWGLALVVWERNHPHCPASQWEIQAYTLYTEAPNHVELTDEVDGPFSFVVP